ncbi:unnamed protein product [Leptidea sinapis]|uniref:Major facilitator superfamily (MFS) profile domain-containing protein n=1 Tax=Leptidea sinapis TaxID=189913 RepID=A0A5E4QHC4_9NEOP|nr:unnamed protein product [Leptidea sinapis]
MTEGEKQHGAGGANAAPQHRKGHREKEREKEKPHQIFPEILDIPHDSRDCGILSWRPLFIQKFSSIKVFVFFLSFLVTLQQALSSGYINSVITTIEKRFEIPSSLSGLIASSYEIGNTNNKTDDNICRLPRALEQDMGGLSRLSQGLPPANLRPDNCIKSTPSTFVPVMVFIVAQVLLGCGGSPLLTLGTTYVDDHVRPETPLVAFDKA